MQKGRSSIRSIPKFVGRITAFNILNHLTKKNIYLYAKFSKIFDVYHQRTNNLVDSIKAMNENIWVMAQAITTIGRKMDNLVVSIDKLLAYNEPLFNSPTEDFYKKAVGHLGSQPPRLSPPML